MSITVSTKSHYTISDHDNFSDIRFSHSDMDTELEADVLLNRFTFETKMLDIEVDNAQDIKQIMSDNDISIEDVMAEFSDFRCVSNKMAEEVDLIVDKFRDLLESEYL